MQLVTVMVFFSVMVKLLLVFIFITASAPLAAQEYRIADRVVDNGDPSLWSNNPSCIDDVTITSDDDTAGSNGYCVMSGHPEYEITYFLDDFPAIETLATIRIWANSGVKYHDEELRKFDLEVTYTDDAGNTATLVMQDVDIGDTESETDHKTVTLTDNADNPVELRNVISVTISDLRNQHVDDDDDDEATEVPFREIQFGITIIPPQMAVSKDVSRYDATGPAGRVVPGDDVLYTITLTNNSINTPDDDTIFLVDRLPDELMFYNADIDDAGPESDPIQFDQNGGGLDFAYMRDVGYANSAAAPESFADCNYTPQIGYDPNVSHICLLPNGTFASSGEFASFKFRAQVH